MYIYSNILHAYLHKPLVTNTQNYVAHKHTNTKINTTWIYIYLHPVIKGFDEYMNIVLDDAEEVNTKSKAKKSVGRLLLKGDCITLIRRAADMRDS